jgi:4-hydroxyphenylacetate 3-monooxygenase
MTAVDRDPLAQGEGYDSMTSTAETQEAISSDQLGLRLPDDLGPERHLMTGAEYRESLRDGRRVIDAAGKVIEDVTSHPALRNAVERNAAAYDAQFESASSAITTFLNPETGLPASLSWKLPRTREDLDNKRELIRWSTYRSLGFHGRPFDYGYGVLAGLFTQVEDIRKHNPQWAENVESLLGYALKRNLMTFSMAADVQSDRSIPIADKPGRLRCVEERPDGMVLSGSKPCASNAAIAHLGYVTTQMTPGFNPDALIYCALPANAPGLTMVLRPEAMTKDATREDHPLDAVAGEEPDAFMIFDHVFIPKDMIFNFGNSELSERYYEVQGLTLWHVLTRLAYRGQIFAAAAQLVANVLGTDRIPQVRDAIADVTAYAETLMAFVIASEETAVEQNGVLIPNERFVTPGRLYSVNELPRVMQLIRDLSGQGMISRMSKAQWERADVGPFLDAFLPGTGVSARDKNALFNFVWDLVSSSHAMRVALFENVNSLPPSGMRARIYQADGRDEWIASLTDFINLQSNG